MMENFLQFISGVLTDDFLGGNKVIEKAIKSKIHAYKVAYNAEFNCLTVKNLFKNIEIIDESCFTVKINGVKTWGVSINKSKGYWNLDRINGNISSYAFAFSLPRNIDEFITQCQSVDGLILEFNVWQ